MSELINEHAQVLNLATDDDQRQHLRCLMTDMFADFMAIIEERRRPNLFHGSRLPMNLKEARRFFKRALLSGTAEDVGRFQREVWKFGGTVEETTAMTLQAAS